MGVDPDILATDPDVVEIPPRSGGKRDGYLERLFILQQESSERQAAIEAFRALQPQAQQPQIQQQSPVKIEANLNLSDILTQSMKVTSDLMQSMQNAGKEQQQAQVQSLHGQLEEIKKKLDVPPTEQRSPLDHYRDVKGLMMELGEGLKKDMGFDNVQTQASDLPRLVEMKKLDLDMRDKEMRWQTEEARKDREFKLQMEQWKIEREDNQQRWSAEHNLKREELSLNQKTRAQASSAFGDIVGAIAESVDVGRANMSGTPEKEPQAKSAPSVFQCEECEHNIEIPADAKKNQLVTCPSCQVEYSLKSSGVR